MTAVLRCLTKVIRLEPFALQTFLPHAEAGTLPVEDLDLIARFVDEHEQLAAERITRQLVFHQNGKAVDAFAVMCCST